LKTSRIVLQEARFIAIYTGYAQIGAIIQGYGAILEPFGYAGQHVDFDEYQYKTRVINGGKKRD
jgi:hypothetical protein